MAKRNVEPATIREVRAWASENGHNVGARGRLKPEVRDAFTKATKRPISEPVTGSAAPAAEAAPAPAKRTRKAKAAAE